MLIVLGGLPGVGKTTIARELARRLHAVHVRIDSIEEAVRRSGVTARSLDDAGYRVGYAVAEDNLRLGHIVIADSVNPIPITRDAWLEVARRVPATAVEVEVECSDTAEHRRRVERRLAETAGSSGPSWQDVVSRDYRVWDRERIVIDTARDSIEQSVAALVSALPSRTPR
jgi:predicted kinase